jgi:predicted regulator of Ras-like GTPase activity (Roadblock/LC7/MglB family)
VSLSPQLVQTAQTATETLHALTGVIAVVVATADGFDIASLVRGEVDVARLAAMASSIAAIGSGVAHEGKLGTCRHVTVGTTGGFVHVVGVRRAGGELVLNVIAGEDAILAQVAYSAAEQARALASA